VKSTKRTPWTSHKPVVTCPAELCLPTAFTVVSCSVYSSTLKMEATCSSETSVDFQRDIRRYISKDNIHPLSNKHQNVILYTTYVHTNKQYSISNNIISFLFFRIVKQFAGLQILIAVIMKSIFFWYVILCNPVKVHRRLFLVCSLHGLFFDPEHESSTFLRNFTVPLRDDIVSHLWKQFDYFMTSREEQVGIMGQLWVYDWQA
jgi:hypothetical protein